MKQFFKISGLIMTAAMLFLWNGSLQGQKNETTAYTATEKWATDAVLDVPESVCYYAEGEVLFVANISGKPSQKDGKGFISKISLSGDILDREWFSNLDAPKGMGIYDNKLFVTNIDEVVAIDLKSSKELNRWKCEGAQFANDIAITESGVVYVSGMENGAIYRIANGEIIKWKAEKSFQRPNGLWAGNDYLYVGAADNVYRIDYEASTFEKFIENTGSVDGLEKIKGDIFLKSDWTGHVHVVAPGQEKQLILNTAVQKVNAADIEFIPSKNLMLVPTFFDNRVVAYEILEK